MDDLISRQDAINAPIKMVSEGLEWVPVYHLKELPSLKLIQEQGMWIVDGHHISCNRCGISLCRTDREGDTIPKNFCPNCGAEMGVE